MTPAEDRRPIAVGFADGQFAALAFAAREAQLSGCELQVVHVFTVPPGPPDALEAAYGIDLEASFRQAGREALVTATDFLTSHYPDVAVRPVLEQGSASRVLKELSETVRLVVLGPDDDTPWYSRLFVSRVSRKLAEEAPCPVVVVPETWDVRAPGRGVTVLVDSRTVAHGPLRCAFEHASRHHEPLRVIHLQDPDDPEAASVSWHDMLRLVDSWRGVHPQVLVDTEIVTGTPDPATVRTFETTGLLVLGRPHQHHLFDLRHRSLARSVIEQADCPVAVVPAT